ncbi:MAG: hypothetical protein IPJ87_03920 [Flavobacteriales bacterium]|jgi:uncharacterized lipoprotein YajG|nr:hypothetical protein [Flavobacteriales bacterium]MBK7941013.1 hypothetical protein [Flavobacteriales bacterium]MBK8949707.1 hypothetical protein [Flavobacteriales bacterium]MBK9701564.1 hypothetical protein [Flavobacteriales bacterium]
MKKTVFLIAIAIGLLTACQNSSNQPANQNEGTAPKQDTAVNVNQQTSNPVDTAKANKEKGEKEEEKDGDD